MLSATNSDATLRASCYSLAARGPGTWQRPVRSWAWSVTRNPRPGRHRGSDPRVRKALSLPPSELGAEPGEVCAQRAAAAPCCRPTWSPDPRPPRPSREPCLRPRPRPPRSTTPHPLRPPLCRLTPKENPNPLPCTPCTLPSALLQFPQPTTPLHLFPRGTPRPARGPDPGLLW